MTLLFAAALLLTASSAWALPVNDVFPTGVTGGARTVALGGADITDPDDYQSVFVNPAALGGMAGTGLDVASDGNQLEDAVVDLDDPKSRSLNIPLKYEFMGVRFASESGWGVGIAAQTPFETDNEFVGGKRRVRKGTGFVVVPVADSNVIHTDAKTYTLAAGKNLLGGRFAFGAGLNYHKATESYRYTPITANTPSFFRSADSRAWTGTFGLLYEPRPWLRTGAVYDMGTRIKFPETLNAGVPNGVTPFRDVSTPDRVSFGLRLVPRSGLSVYLKGRCVLGRADTVITGSGIFPGSPTSTVESGRGTAWDGGWGLEYILWAHDDLETRLWGGGYYEDANIQGGYTRYHRTAGFSFSPWFLNLSMAVDSAEFYDNFVVGFGVDLLKTTQATAKSMGYRLPI